MYIIRNNGKRIIVEVKNVGEIYIKSDQVIKTRNKEIAEVFSNYKTPKGIKPFSVIERATLEDEVETNLLYSTIESEVSTLLDESKEEEPDVPYHVQLQEKLQKKNEPETCQCSPECKEKPIKGKRFAHGHKKKKDE